MSVDIRLERFWRGAKFASSDDLLAEAKKSQALDGKGGGENAREDAEAAPVDPGKSAPRGGGGNSEAGDDGSDLQDATSPPRAASGVEESSEPEKARDSDQGEEKVRHGQRGGSENSPESEDDDSVRSDAQSGPRAAAGMGEKDGVEGHGEFGQNEEGPESTGRSGPMRQEERWAETAGEDAGQDNAPSGASEPIPHRDSEGKEAQKTIETARAAAPQGKQAPSDIAPGDRSQNPLSGGPDAHADAGKQAQTDKSDAGHAPKAAGGRPEAREGVVRKPREQECAVGKMSPSAHEGDASLAEPHEPFQEGVASRDRAPRSGNLDRPRQDTRLGGENVPDSEPGGQAALADAASKEESPPNDGAGQGKGQKDDHLDGARAEKAPADDEKSGERGSVAVGEKEADKPSTADGNSKEKNGREAPQGGNGDDKTDASPTSAESESGQSGDKEGTEDAASEASAAKGPRATDHPQDGESRQPEPWDGRQLDAVVGAQPSSIGGSLPPSSWATAQVAGNSTGIERIGQQLMSAPLIGIDPASMVLRDRLSAKTTRDNAFAAAVQAGAPAERPASLKPPAALLRLEDPFAGQGQDYKLAEMLNSRLAGQARKAPRSAFDLTPEQHTLRRMQMTFARVVSKLAEDFAGQPTTGDEEWDIDALISRSMDRRTLQACRRSHERESLIVVMDVSGSCRNHAEFFQRVSALATSQKDVELMSGNNGRIEAWWHPATSTWRQVTCGRWPFRHRTVLFFGDHDGEEIVCDASHRNRVTWFSNETRPGRCESEPPHFHGWYVPCGDDADLVRVARRLR